MATQNKKRQFVWTVIPAGRTAPIDGVQMALFSVLLIPRLIGPAGARLTLSDFGMQAWPQRLADVGIDIFRAATRLTGVRRVPLINADGRQVLFYRDEQTAAWQALFPASTLVRPYQPTAYSERRTVDFPTSEAGTTISTAYGNTARVLAQYDAHDRRHASGADPDAAQREAQRRSALAQITAEWQDGLWPETTNQSAMPAERSPLRQAYDFYRRETQTGFTPLGPLDQEADEELDFHDIVARLADHPVLMRALGMLLDFATPTAQLAGAANTELRSALRWPNPDPNPPAGWLNASQEDLSPRTAYTLAGLRFVPRTPGPAATPPPQGLLPLAGAGPAGAGTNPRFEMMPFDVDGAALRMVNVAESDRDHPPPFADTSPGLPTLRSVGFALVEKTRSYEHEQRLQRAEDRSTVSGLLGSPLSADNLTAGYRLDVFDATTRRWYSLCQRRVRYSIGNVQIGQGAGADGVRGILEEGYIRPDSVTTGAGADDALYVHQTVARWDGWSLVAPRPERVLDPVPVPPQPFTVHVELEQGSLPRLRFGRRYRLRARLVDLAGGGLRRTEVGATEQQTEEFIHRRYEPLLPPELAPSRVYTDGEGHDQMVIRSDRGVSAQKYATTHNYRPTDLRHLFPPKSSLELAIQHEREEGFNAALGPSASSSEVRRLFDVATRADLDLGDVPGAHLHEGGKDSPDYFVLPETPVDLPWLADPAAWRIAVRVRSRPIDPHTGTEGATSGFSRPCWSGRSCSAELSYTWKGLWPNLVPIILRVVEAPEGCNATMELTGQPGQPPNRRTLTVALGPTEQVTVDIVSCPSIDDIAANGIADWAGASPTDPCHPITKHTYEGCNPLVSPPRTITLMHAVQRPLVDPSGRLSARRQMGDTHAILGTRELNIDVPSTGRIDIRATWTDTDDTAGPRPTPKKIVDATVGSYNVEHRPLYEALPPIRQEFTDTRRRRVTYTVTAVSRFHDYFGSITDTNPNACTVKGVLGVTDVPSSARPPAPALRYLMPTSRWSREGTGTSMIRSSRRGGGVRAFFERPWFVSGEDEKLAVLAWPQSTSIPPEVLRRVSVAGRDPIWDTGTPATGLNSVLNPGHFNAEFCPEFLAESGATVSAVVHPVKFDDELKCWYADIDLSPLVEPSYFPFVRLGLARYQANTVDSQQRLSPPIVGEPIQLLPHRELTVKRSPGSARVVVSGLGPGGSTPNVVQAELQVYEGAASAAEDALIGPAGWKTIGRKTAALGAEFQLDIPQPGSRRMRISVTETESYPVPASDGTPTSRLVYADIVDITA